MSWWVAPRQRLRPLSSSQKWRVHRLFSTQHPCHLVVPLVSLQRKLAIHTLEFERARTKNTVSVSRFWAKSVYLSTQSPRRAWGPVSLSVNAHRLSYACQLSIAALSPEEQMENRYARHGQGFAKHCNTASVHIARLRTQTDRCRAFSPHPASRVTAQS